MFIRACIAALALFTMSSTPQDGPAKVAILGFRAQGSDLDDQLASALSSRLTGTRGFVVVERNNLEKVVRELNLNESGMIDQSDTASFGNIKSVDYLIYGIISRPTTEQNTGKDILGVRFTNYRTELTATIRYTRVKTAEIVAEPRITGHGDGRSRDASFEAAIKDVATQFVKELQGGSKANYAKVVRLDTDGKMVWLDIGTAQSVKAGDFYEVGYLDSVELDDGKKVEDFKSICEAKVDSVLESNCKLICGKWDGGVLGLGKGFKRNDKLIGTLIEAKKTHELVARQKIR